MTVIRLGEPFAKEGPALRMVTSPVLQSGWQPLQEGTKQRKPCIEWCMTDPDGDETKLQQALKCQLPALARNIGDAEHGANLHGGLSSVAQESCWGLACLP